MSIDYRDARTEQILDPARGPVRRMPLSLFRMLVGEHPLGAADRRLILDQASGLVDNLYVHLPQKRTMYGIDPSQQLRLLARREPHLDDAAFHRELLRIFDGLRDMHTTYVPPEPFRGRVLLGFTLERYWDPLAGHHRYLVSKKAAGDYQHDCPLPLRAVVTHWNGMPIEVAVQENAEAEAGGNPAARLARGLESLTSRNVALSPLPADDWVYIGYWDGDQHGECRVDWWVEPSPPLPPDGAGEDGGLPAGAARSLGVSLRTELTRQLRSDLLRGAVPENGNRRDAGRDIDTRLRGELSARTVRGAGVEYGYLRVFTFLTANGDVAGFVDEVERLLTLMPENGLIIDVRGNGGGYIDAAEGLLQLLSREPIGCEPMQFISSRLTYQLCGLSRDLLPWQPSIGEANETGAQFSAAFPLSRPRLPRADRAARRVLLVTDALSYSATDMLAAGFQDNRLGLVLGVDDRTGAGGANVWSHRLLQQAWPGGPFRRLPRRARLTAAVRRSLRVGLRHGRVLEDYGVNPDHRHRMTRDDLLFQNVDLIAFGIRILREMDPPRG